MPQLDHSGPEADGPKTGRKLGRCKKTDAELSQKGELGIGQGKQHHSENKKNHGKGKRLKYFQTIDK